MKTLSEIIISYEDSKPKITRISKEKAENVKKILANIK